MTPEQFAALAEDRVLGQVLAFLILAVLVGVIVFTDWRSLKTERDRWKAKP